jgi:2-dehydro-3-deoxyphosphogluconate aldolase/(4S)-4-hydroxy-2-oxoglutarate aldolase
MDVERFEKLPLMGILRGGDTDVVDPLVETLAEAGLETLEIAMNTPDAAAMIRRAADAAGGRLMIGAGTVTTLERLEAALDAGAGFLVSPTLDSGVVEEARRRSVPMFPGALTPQEIHEAWSAGATMVKVFPAKVFGPEYFKEVKGPLDDVRLLACGGVSAANMTEYFDAGADAVAFGGSVFAAPLLTERRFEQIAAEVSELVRACRSRDRLADGAGSS